MISYYDFYFPETIDPETGETVESRKLTDQDLKLIKKQMDKIISKGYPITREEVTREEAEKRIKAINEPFKLEILERLVEPITLYHIGDEWWDLCAGPHLKSTNQIKFPRRASLSKVLLVLTGVVTKSVRCFNEFTQLRGKPPTNSSSTRRCWRKRKSVTIVHWEKNWISFPSR